VTPNDIIQQVGLYPVEYALRQRYYSVLDKLLAFESTDLSLPSSDGRTLLDLLLEDKRAARLLVERRARELLGMGSRGLELATRYGNAEMAALLVRRGVRPVSYKAALLAMKAWPDEPSEERIIDAVVVERLGDVTELRATRRPERLVFPFALDVVEGPAMVRNGKTYVVLLPEVPMLFRGDVERVEALISGKQPSSTSVVEERRMML